MTNRNEDYAIIAARKRVMEAQEALEKRPGPDGALQVQRVKREWDALKALSIVKGQK